MDANVKICSGSTTKVIHWACRILNGVCEFTDTCTALSIFSCSEFPKPAALACRHHQKFSHTSLYDTNSYLSNFAATINSLIVNHVKDLDQPLPQEAIQGPSYTTVTIVAPKDSDFFENRHVYADQRFKLLIAVVKRITKRINRMLSNLRNQDFSKSKVLNVVNSTFAGDREDARRKSCHS